MVRYSDRELETEKENRERRRQRKGHHIKAVKFFISSPHSGQERQGGSKQAVCEIKLMFSLSPTSTMIALNN